MYPAHCVDCSQLIAPSAILCVQCAGSLKPVVSFYLPLTQKKSLKVVASYAYQDAARSLLIKKFSQNSLASKQLAQLMLQTIAPENLQADYIIPIPLHWTRYAQRGFNQSTEIARVISKQTQVPMIQLLKRKKRTKFQSRLSKDQREHNLDDAFDLKRWYGYRDLSFLEQKNIILIDDLCTTGATLKSAAQSLLPLKPLSLTAIVACRAL